MNKTRYEYVGGGSDKFYEIEWHTPTQGEATITYGRNGTAGQQVTYSMTEARKKEREKIAKGYKQIVVPVKRGILMMGKPGVGKSFAVPQVIGAQSGLQIVKMLNKATLANAPQMGIPASVQKQLSKAINQTMKDLQSFAGVTGFGPPTGWQEGIGVSADDEMIQPATGQIWKRLKDPDASDAPKFVKIMARADDDEECFIFASSADGKKWKMPKRDDEADNYWFNDNFSLVQS